MAPEAAAAAESCCGAAAAAAECGDALLDDIGQFAACDSPTFSVGLRETSFDSSTVVRTQSEELPLQVPPNFAPLETLTSGMKKQVHGGAVQAHICVVANESDVKMVMQAFHQAEAFNSVASWSYAYRIVDAAGPSQFLEGIEDGLDEGCGDRILGVLRRAGLHGLLLVVSRWQDYGASSGLDTFGTSLYSIVTERCKDLLANLNKAMGAPKEELQSPEKAESQQFPPAPKNFDFGFLPPLPEPKERGKYSKNHFLADLPVKRQISLPSLFSGGDVRIWMENDRHLCELSEPELRALRFLRQPDPRIERVLQAVAVLRGQGDDRPARTAAARWGQCKEVLRSPTFRTELLLLDSSQVPLEAAQHVESLLEGLNSEEIRCICAGAGALLDWARGVVQWRLQGPPSDDVDASQSQELKALRPREAVHWDVEPAPLAPAYSRPCRIHKSPAARMTRSCWLRSNRR
eukprot:gnl/TRDRNA2_/TRDRNA2_184445_c0_seq1.p1 gnl/TRDRNA2_/TRDRNA2_184445_c0~~gnl/TRDRNA2_/TRDRNA2_184445_c0_seq1.p1  ORF type:complete len:485 (-),score=94.27 gnl/TRDRNA2_/TRDRNA2_184445_c0_seq1:35-1420(-)